MKKTLKSVVEFLKREDGPTAVEAESSPPTTSSPTTNPATRRGSVRFCGRAVHVPLPLWCRRGVPVGPQHRHQRLGIERRVTV